MIERGACWRVAADCLTVARAAIASIAVAILLSSASADTCAQNDDIDFPRLLGVHAPIKEARVVFVSPAIAFRTRLTESHLRTIGCAYYSREKSKIDALVDVLSHGGIKRSFRPDLKGEVRNAALFILDDETEIKLLLGKQYSNASNIDGWLVLPRQEQSQSVVADNLLIGRMYEWAARAEASRDRAIGNETDRNGCGPLINPLRNR